ncbi:MAG: hypothetical protein LBS27_00885 [Bifidobacteriaceae bacterium]|jgi:hypothetical protein|nr:hypothetical protein [Bifidobacteriaceae bacterium]
MTLPELILVILIGSIVLGLIGTAMVSMMKHDSKNMIRQSRVDGIREISVWLGDALTYAAVPIGSASSGATVFSQAEPQKMEFTAALPVVGDSQGQRISRVTVKLGETCWGSPGDDPGVLHRCVQYPKILSDNSEDLCTKGSAGCPDDLFEDLVVARDVDDSDPIFTYFVGSSGVSSSVSAGALGSIGAVELLVTVVGPETGRGSDPDLQATVFKRFTVQEWRKF